MLDFLKELNSSTLMILVFAAILVVFLIILIIVTVNVLKSDNSSDEEDDDEEEDKKSSKKGKKAEDTEQPEAQREDTSEADKSEDDESETADEEDEADDEEYDEESEDDAEYEDDESEEDDLDSEYEAYKNNPEAKTVTSDTKKIEVSRVAAASKVKKADIEETEEDDSYEDQDPADRTDVLPSVNVEPETEDVKDEIADKINRTVAAEKTAFHSETTEEALNRIKAKVGIAEPAIDESDEVDEDTNELDTKSIRSALNTTDEEEVSADESALKAAAQADSDDYNASLDSAFVSNYVNSLIPENPDAKDNSYAADFKLTDEAIESATEASLAVHEKLRESAEEPEEETKPVLPDFLVNPNPANSTGDNKITVNPVNAVNINTVNSVEKVDTKSEDAGIGGISDMENFLTENPVPVKKKKKIKKKDKIFADKFESGTEELTTGEYFWYNSQDIDGLKRKEDMYLHCHYFNKPSQAVLPLIVEMYDCAFVRTEEIQRIAYGINFKSLKMKDILASKRDLNFDRSKAVKEPTEKDIELIYKHWCEYVDNFMGIITINAPEDMKAFIKKKLYEYGHSDVDVLLYSPE